MRCLRLPFNFDPDRLRQDLARVEPEEWIPHINRHDYEGHWSGAALRSIGGSSTNIVPDTPDLANFRAAPLLDRCPYFREVLSVFRCPLRAVRLLRLHAGSSIAEHIDNALDFDSGEVRLHIPILTNDDVRFFLDGARLVMAPGECWYTNVNLPHSVENRSGTDRIHLVLDCVVDDWLRGVFAAAPRPTPDHYAARLALAAPPRFDRLMTAAAEFAADCRPPAQFRAEGNTLVFAWHADHTWQLRVSLESPAEGWTARIESSPDPERHYRANHEALLRCFASTFPGLAATEEGLS